MPVDDLEPVDVVIVGAGPAGLAAGLFAARYALRTLIFDGAHSLLRQCAYLDNYLGFPGGIDVAEFLRLARLHALEAGCEVVSQPVTEIERDAATTDRFRVHTRGGASVRATRIIAASGHPIAYLRTLREPALFGPDGELQTDAIDRHGRTRVPGLYAAGAIAGIENQALISAGHGAQVALGMIRDIRAQRGPWDSLAQHLDWQVPRGRYDSERWAARVRRYFEAESPAVAREDARFHALVERWIVDKRAQQLDRAELARRRQRARRLRAAASAEPSNPDAHEVPAR